MVRSMWCCVGVIAVLVLSGLGVQAEECAITVHPGESIQLAIDAAPEGAVICLSAGQWEEHITIGKSLTLRGAGAEETTIRGLRPDTAVIRVHTPEDEEGMVVLEGLGMAGGSGMYGPGLLVDGASRVAVTDCAAFDNGYGIWLRGTAQATLRGTHVLENAATGIWLADGSQSTIVDCTVSENAYSGIWLTGEAQSVIDGSTTRGNREGISLTASSQAKIEGSSIVGNQRRGLSMNELARVSIAGSSVAENGWEGIYIAGSAEVTLEGNVIQENQRYGVLLFERPCIATDDVFAGYVAGRRNLIPWPELPVGNRFGAVCPADLDFLLTTEGGALDRRE